MKQQPRFSLPPKRNVWSALGAVLLGIALLLLALRTLRTTPAAYAQGPDTAHVVVQFAQNDTIVRRIQFSAPISGLEALQQTGLNVITKDFGWGVSVCGIEGVGDPAANCFGSGFWASYYLTGTTWAGYMVGPSDSVITDGAVELWSWQAGFAPLDLPDPDAALAASQALDWLQGQQSSADGGYGNTSASVESLLSIAANHYRAFDWRTASNAPSLLSHILDGATAYADTGAAAAGKLAVGLAAEGDYWPTGAKKPMDYYITATGVFTGGYGAGFAGPQAWGILGTVALSQSVPPKAVDYLKSIANADGGWSWGPGNSDTNGTALAIQALIAAGEPVTSSAVISGLHFLQSAQNPDGGFPYDPASPWGTASDANSTAYVIQALHAVGKTGLQGTGSFGTGSFIINPTTALSYLLSLQLPDGSFEWQKGFGSSLFASQQAVPALLGRPFPFKKAALPDGLTLTTTVTTAGGGLTYNDPDGTTVVVEVPAGAVSGTVELRFSPAITLSTAPPTGSLQFAGRIFRLEAYRNGSLLTPFTFNKPVTLTLEYRDADIAGLDEESLQLLFWNGSGWDTAGVQVVGRLSGQNKILVTITHLTEFALFGRSQRFLYLPVVLK